MPVLLLLTEKERHLADSRGAGGGGRGWWRRQMIRRREGLVIYSKLNTLRLSPFPLSQFFFSLRGR